MLKLIRYKNLLFIALVQILIALSVINPILAAYRLDPYTELDFGSNYIIDRIDSSRRLRYQRLF